MEREEAIKILRDTHDKALFSVRNALETLIPELRESEDERIRKTLVKYFKRFNQEDMWNYEVSLKDIVAYLEKQKELPFVKDVIPGLPGLYFYDGERMHFQGNPATEENPYDFAMSLQKQKEQKPAEKQDYSGLNDLERAIHRGFLAAGVENVHVTIIKETAQDCLSHLPAEWSEEDEEYFKWFDKFFRAESVVLGGKDIPQDKYLWFKSLHPQPKQEWSEEDEIVFADAIRYIQDYGETSSDKYTQLRTKEIVDRLKSLCPQPPVEWTEEDRRMLRACIEAVGSMSIRSDVQDLRDWLKSLCPDCCNRPKPAGSWRPSEEQMKALDKAIPVCMGVAGCKEVAPLESLYNDLKKLI